VLTAEIPMHKSTTRPPTTRRLLYRVWFQMTYRCSDPRSRDYNRYGGRGITVDPQWRGLAGFEQFVRDMGPRPSPKHTINRIDNDLGYSATNCRWATRACSARNRSTTHLIERDGKRLCMKDWAALLGVKWTTVQYRLRNWGIERTFENPPVRRRVPVPCTSPTIRA
jgi:hypothetical protein